MKYFLIFGTFRHTWAWHKCPVNRKVGVGVGVGGGRAQRAKRRLMHEDSWESSEGRYEKQKQVQVRRVHKRASGALPPTHPAVGCSNLARQERWQATTPQASRAREGECNSWLRGMACMQNYNDSLPGKDEQAAAGRRRKKKEEVDSTKKTQKNLRNDWQ